MENSLREESKRNRKSIPLDHLFGKKREGGETLLESRGSIGQGRLQIAAMALNGIANRLRPGQDLGSRSLFGVPPERAGDVEKILCLVLQFRESFHPLGKRLRGILQGSRHRRGGFPKFNRRDRLRALGVVGLFHRLEKQVVCVPGSLQYLRAKGWVLGKLAARLSQGDQVPSQVTAVYRGYIDGLQRPEVPGIVPVAEVAPDPVQFGHGHQSSLEPLRHVQNPDPAVVVGSHRAQEIETQVRRRGAVGFDRLRVLLKIVRRKGMLLLVNEGFEEAPCAAGDEAQGSRLLGGEDL